MNSNYLNLPFAKNDVRTNDIIKIPENNLFDLLQKNLGKLATFNIMYQNSEKEIRGILENYGNDYILISEPSNGKWGVLMLYTLNFIEFEEEVNK